MESFKKTNKREGVSGLALKTIALLGLMAMPSIMNAQESGTSSQDSLQADNTSIMGDIVNSSKVAFDREQASKEHRTYSGFIYNTYDTQKERVNENAPIPKPEIGKKYLNFVEVKDYIPRKTESGTIDDGFEVGGSYGINTPDGGTKEVFIVARDTDRDGKADEFSATEDVYQKGHVTYDVHHGHVKNIHFDASKHQTPVDTGPLDANGDSMASRSEIIKALGEEKGKELLKELDARYHEMLEIAKEHADIPSVVL